MGFGLCELDFESSSSSKSESSCPYDSADTEFLRPAFSGLIDISTSNDGTVYGSLLFIPSSNDPFSSTDHAKQRKRKNQNQNQNQIEQRTKQKFSSFFCFYSNQETKPRDAQLACGMLTTCAMDDRYYFVVVSRDWVFATMIKHKTFNSFRVFNLMFGGRIN